jgi:hypothetical protein
MEKLGGAARVLDDATAAGERLGRWKMSLLNRVWLSCWTFRRECVKTDCQIVT